jgi:hypothetical protein
VTLKACLGLAVIYRVKLWTISKLSSWMILRAHTNLRLTLKKKSAIIYTSKTMRRGTSLSNWSSQPATGSSINFWGKERWLSRQLWSGHNRHQCLSKLRDGSLDTVAFYHGNTDVISHERLHMRNERVNLIPHAVGLIPCDHICKYAASGFYAKFCDKIQLLIRVSTIDLMFHSSYIWYCIVSYVGVAVYST